ncbi:hypothetical protein JN11_04794 [Mucilaginibacter frigoritolerans]|uniref:Lipocalin-like protein n=1 Tax=Mucilaginibacter frigoritolerans TaxID=652788 RepID=A0A562TLS8_9SPHI|nr:hypothetical protein [Mucilaginibacter frigoritolerans]TWI94188.1 hypothetical protein JN11_04794 [Mucilaginibacter frigoritolerans]
MKNIYTPIFIIGILLSLYSCHKTDSADFISTTSTTSNSAVYNTAMVGKWNIVSDSTYVGAGSGNHAVDYAGTAGDYFIILANGTIYTKEGSQLDTLSYHMSSDTGIVISSFGVILNGVPQVSKIITYTSTSLVIASPESLTPGGIFWRKVTLSK